MSDNIDVLNLSELKQLDSRTQIEIGELFIKNNSKKFELIFPNLPIGVTRYGSLEANTIFLTKCLMSNTTEMTDLYLKKLQEVVDEKKVSFPHSIKINIGNIILNAISENKITTLLHFIDKASKYNLTIDDYIYLFLPSQKFKTLGLNIDSYKNYYGESDNEEEIDTQESKSKTKATISLGQILFSDYAEKNADNLNQLQDLIFAKFKIKMENCKSFFNPEFLSALTEVEHEDDEGLEIFKKYIAFMNTKKASVKIDDDFHLKFYLKNSILQKIYLDIFGEEHINQILDKNKLGYRALSSIETTLEDKTLTNFKTLLYRYTPEILHRNHDDSLSNGGSVAMRILEKGGLPALKILLNKAQQHSEESPVALINATAWVFENSDGRRKKGDLLAYCVAQNQLEAALFLIKTYPKIDKTYAKAAVKYLTTKKIDEAGAANSAWDRIILNDLHSSIEETCLVSSTETQPKKKKRL